MSFATFFLASSKQFIVITGFNTDIKHGGVTYHVQTEDKGLKTPLILSLVYQGGTILASKRSPYDDLVKEKFDEKVLEVRLNRQHKLICAAIRAGRIDDLKQMTAKDSTRTSKAPVIQKEVPQPVPPPVLTKPVVEKVPAAEVKEPQDFVPEAKPIPKPQVETVVAPKVDQPVSAPPSADGIPKPEDEPVWDIPIIEDVTIVEEEVFDVAQIVEEEIILPPEAVEIIGDLEQFGGLLENELQVKILGENRFASGQRKNINILVCRGEEDTAVEDAEVMVKVIGSDFRPSIYHSKADGNGVATVQLELPSFRSGRAAILVRAMVEGEEAELRRAITPE